MEVYERAARAVPRAERLAIYDLYVARASDFFGVGKVGWRRVPLGWLAGGRCWLLAGAAGGGGGGCGPWAVLSLSACPGGLAPPCALALLLPQH
jgi:hypothetical protein